MNSFQIYNAVFMLALLGSCENRKPACSPSKTGLKLVIDHDGGADDAWAITMSVLYQKYFNGPKVVGITTSFGNVNESQSFINTARILKLCNRSDIPVYRGAQEALIKGIKSDHYFGYDGLGDDGKQQTDTNSLTLGKEHAAEAFIYFSKKYKGDLIIMSTGPSTNIALAASLDPDFIGRLSQLYIGAGHIYSEAYPKPEFNAAMDPEAYSIATKHGRKDKVTIVPFSQVYTSLNISKEWRLNVLGAIDTPIIQALNKYERVSLSDAQNSWILLDTAVAAFLLDNNIVEEYKYSKNGILLCGTERGINTNNFTSEDPNSRLVYSANVETYKKLLLEVYSAQL